MKKRTIDRHSVFDIEKCIENINNSRYDLVMVTAQRTRELRRKSLREDKRHICIGDALLEAQAGMLDADTYMAKVK
jgi:DNA-directed RNA polymerase omega subunit